MEEEKLNRHYIGRTKHVRSESVLLDDELDEYEMIEIQHNVDGEMNMWGYKADE